MLEYTRTKFRGRRMTTVRQDTREAEMRAAKLKEYPAEMQAFADFLKRRFFGKPLAQPEYTTIEAAKALGMEIQTVTRNILRGNLAAKKRGRDYFISHEELERFKNARRRPGRPSRV